MAKNEEKKMPVMPQANIGPIERVRFTDQLQINGDMVQSISAKAKKCQIMLTGIGVRFWFPETQCDVTIPYAHVFEIQNAPPVEEKKES